jgi:hypothetical protein
MKVCRICLDSEWCLISPCDCKGTVQYVHLECLKKWRTISKRFKCEICNSYYQINRSIWHSSILFLIIGFVNIVCLMLVVGYGVLILMSVHIVLAFFGLRPAISCLSTYNWNSELRFRFDVLYYYIYRAGPGILLVAPCLSTIEKTNALLTSFKILLIWAASSYIGRISYFVALASDLIFIIATIVGLCYFILYSLGTVGVLSPTVKLVLLDLKSKKYK